MNPFTKDIGVHQGRIAIDPAPEGSFVYELGHALLADSNVNGGDYHEISQSVTFSPQAKLLRASIVVKVPPTLPVAHTWEISAWLNATRMYHRVLRISKRTLVLDDVRISLYGALVGANTLKFRLELVGASDGGFG